MNTMKIVSVVLVLLGLFYAIAPHNVHVSSGLGLGLEHTMHIAVGVILVVIGLVAWWKGKKPAKK